MAEQDQRGTATAAKPKRRISGPVLGTIIVATITALGGVAVAYISKPEVPVPPTPSAVPVSLQITNIKDGSSPRDGDNVEVAVTGEPDRSQQIWFLARWTDQDGRPWWPQGPCTYLSPDKVRCRSMAFGTGPKGTPLEIMVVMLNAKDAAYCAAHMENGFPPGKFEIDPLVESDKIKIKYA